MNGVEFYSFLQETFQQSGQVICDDFTFQEWYYTSDGAPALRFAQHGTARIIPRDILISTWDAYAYSDNEEYLLSKIFSTQPNDSRVLLLDSLLKMCSPLREMAA